MTLRTPVIDFFVAGFSKCGTTSLCARLAQHPDIFIPEVKETRFFSSENFDQRKQAHCKMYAAATNEQQLGDGSPVYSTVQSTSLSIERIRENNPRCQFIFIARHPRKRIESLYREMHHSGAHYGTAPPFSLSAFLQAYPNAVENTLFYDRIVPFIEEFGRDAVLPVFLEDFQADSQRTASSCCAHIGVDPTKLPPVRQQVLNVGTEKLYDTRLMRKLRSHPRTGFRIANLPLQRQNELFRKLRLRRPFGSKAITWDEPAQIIYQQTIAPQARKFLDLCGKPQDFWQLD